MKEKLNLAEPEHGLGLAHQGMEEGWRPYRQKGRVDFARRLHRQRENMGGK